MRAVLLFYMLTLVFLLGGCVEQRNYIKTDADISRHREEGYPRTLQNYDSNRKKINIELTEKPKRVLAHHQNIMEALLALDEGHSIVAGAFTGTETKQFTGRYAKLAEAIPIINQYDFDLETVLMLRPDLIIGWQSTFSPRLLRPTSFWRQRGVNTYIAANSNSILPIGTIDDECKLIRDLGYIFNRQELANSLTKEIKEELEHTKKQVSGLPHPRTMILEFMGKNITVYDKNRLAGDMVTSLGGELIPAGRTIDAETLIELNPDVIFIVRTNGVIDENFYRNRIIKNKAFRTISAVRNNRIYPVPLILMYVSGIRTIEGIKLFKKGLYPELEGKE